MGDAKTEKTRTDRATRGTPSSAGIASAADGVAAAPARERRSGRLGRRIATVLVWIAIVYVIAIGMISVIPQVFWPARASVPTATTCVEGLQDLRSELLAEASDRIANPPTASDGIDRWLERWDRRHAAIEARCDGDAHDAWNALGRMRQRLHATLVRFDAEEGALAREMNDTLARLSGGERNVR